jgi:ribosome-binding protein aMBF1 (putative translation factor)
MFSTPTADAFTKSPDGRNATAIARNSINAIDAWIGSRLRARRSYRGLTQRELSQQLGIDCSDLSAYEAGSRRVSANLLLRITKLLEVHPRYFFQGYTEGALENCLEESLF